MAVYSYKCSDCGNVFCIEATIQEKEDGKGEKFVCTKCKSKNIKQEVSASNFLKNIFRNDNKSCGCSSDVGACDGAEKKEKKQDCCKDTNDRGGCCG